LKTAEIARRAALRTAAEVRLQVGLIAARRACLVVRLPEREKFIFRAKIRVKRPAI
jgi:hypothetical protein